MSENKMHCRAAVVRQSSDGTPITLDKEKRTLEFVVSTEAPIPMMDWERGEVIPEVLLSRGARFPKQVPLLDTHDRGEIDRVLGSVRELRVDDGAVIGRAAFSSIPKAVEAFTKYAEGHLTDFSAGYVYSPNDVRHIPKGEEADIGGRTWKGPVNVVVGWTLKEASAVPIGADPAAKARADAAPSHTEEDNAMNEEERKELERLRRLERERQEKAREEEQEKAVQEDIDELRRRDAAERAKARKAELDRQRAISAECAKWEGKGFDLGDIEAELIRDGVSVQESTLRIGDLVRAQLDKRDQERGVDVSGPISVTADERDKFREYATAGLTVRAGHEGLVDEKLRSGHDLVGMHLRDLMIKCERMANVRELGFNQRSLSSSDFPYILADSQNKIMVASYMAAEVTWRQWCRQATTSRVDNGTLPQVSFISKARHLKMNDGAYEFLQQSDAAETYVMDKIGGMLHISEEAILNDDLLAISNQAGNLGDVIARGVNIKVYGDGTTEDPGVIVGAAGVGETMRDATALFTTGHGNYVASGSGAAPNVTTLGAAKSALRTQTDIGDNYPLNLRPGYLLVPAALESVAERQLNSEFQVIAGTAGAVTDSGQRNPFNGAMELVVEPLLDGTGVAGATTRWYVAAANRDMNPWVIFHEATNDQPAIDSRMEWLNDGMTWKGNIKVATKAPDWRGVYCNYGA